MKEDQSKRSTSNEDQPIDGRNLPREISPSTTTQQPEEFIDKSSIDKDEHDVPRPPADEA